MQSDTISIYNMKRFDYKELLENMSVSGSIKLLHNTSNDWYPLLNLGLGTCICMILNFKWI